MPDAELNTIRAILKKNKNKIFVVLKIFIAAGLLLFLINWINFSKLTDAFRKANVYFLILTLGLGVINIYLQFLKWELICKDVLKISSRRKIFHSLFYGFASGIFTPFRVGEYVGRAIPFKDNGLLEITLATIIDKFFPLFVILSSGSIATIFYIHFYYGVNISITISLLAVLVVLFFLVFFLFKNEKFWNEYMFAKLGSTRLFKKLIPKIEIFRNINASITTKVLMLSILFYITFILQFALLSVAFSGQFKIFTFFWAGCLSIFSKTLIPAVSFGELGIREGVTIFFLSSFGVTEAAAFNSSLTLFLINLVLPSLIGLYLLAKKN